VVRSGKSLGSLDSAVRASRDGDSIVFNLPRDSETILLDSQLVISNSLSIDGGNQAGSGKPVTIKVPVTYAEAIANPSLNPSPYRAMKILKGKVFLRNLTIQGGRSQYYLNQYQQPIPESWCGGAVYINAYDSAVVTVTKVTISGSAAYDSLDLSDSYSMPSTDIEAYGGGIYNGATLTLDSCIVSGNQCIAKQMRTGETALGGGIYSSGKLKIRASVIAGNSVIGLSSNYAFSGSHGGEAQGGGIYGAGELEILSSSIVNNSVSSTNRYSEGARSDVKGGGIAHYGRVKIVNSTISENSAKSVAQSIGSSAWGSPAALGGGLYLNGKAEIIACTIAGNTSSVSGGTTPVSGGGGIFQWGDMDILNTIVVGNANTASGTANDIQRDSGSLRAYYNVVGTLKDGIGTSQKFWDASNLSGKTSLEVFGSAKPRSADNGGPSQTLAITSNSVAAGNGSRVGSYLENEVPRYNAFWNGTTWLSSSTGSTVAGVTEISTDQRGVDRDLPPSVGAFYVKGALDIVRKSVQPIETISFRRQGNLVRLFNRTGATLFARVLGPDGRLIRAGHFDATFDFDLSSRESGVYLIRIDGLRGRSRTVRVAKAS
jgi:hypothetical protein